MISLGLYVSFVLAFGGKVAAGGMEGEAKELEGCIHSPKMHAYTHSACTDVQCVCACTTTKIRALKLFGCCSKKKMDFTEIQENISQHLNPIPMIFSLLLTDF